MIRDGLIAQKDEEFDWTDGLRQWKRVMKSQGAVSSMADKKVNKINSSAFSVLGVLQANITCEQLQDRVEKSLVNGLRRSAGLQLIK